MSFQEKYHVESSPSHLRTFLEVECVCQLTEHRTVDHHEEGVGKN